MAMASGRAASISCQGGVERGHVAVDVAEERDARGHQRSAPSGGMMKRQERLAGDLAVDRGDRPAAAEAPAELLHRDLEAEHGRRAGRRA